MLTEVDVPFVGTQISAALVPASAVLSLVVYLANRVAGLDAIFGAPVGRSR
jgi:hypothetical protein